jgi:hypothetical protein
MGAVPAPADPVAEPRSAVCSCEHDRALTQDAELVLEPDARAWRGWTGGLEALLAGLADGPAHSLILTQPRHARWVELLVGHGQLRVDVSSNTTLRGDDRLSAEEEHRLARLRFQRPAVGRTTWRLEEPIALVARSTELVSHVLVAILGLDARAPLHVDRFGADHPCAACTTAA